MKADSETPKTNSEKLGGDCETGAVEVCREMVNLYVVMVARVLRLSEGRSGNNENASCRIKASSIRMRLPSVTSRLLISSLTWWRLQVSLKFHGGGNFHIIFNLTPSQFEVPWGWELSYLL